ncbi:DUF4915 domain-containing protein [Trinickia acidisoli]|uniref:DUF4915 domain-containing protein n=1 Tax=Trinickia acidisoli TaxID=2767482 RepID=UPI001A8F47B6|nr:DUF4915 domain-containing protein [Trinickia acidisoli]
MSRLLISFRVSSPPGHALAQFNTDTEAFDWIDVGDPVLKIYGAMGICRHNTRYFVVFQARREGKHLSCLGELDAKLRLTRLAALRRVKDGHSIVAHDNALLIVSSGTNQVIRVVWPQGGEPKESVFFEIAPGADTLHMNALQAYHGKLYLSMFGPRGDGLWRDASDGRVIRLDDGAVVTQGLYHPHALFVDNDALLCVSSMKSRIYRVDGDGSGRAEDEPTALPALDGYLRGAATDDRYIYVGTSTGRTRSRATGAIVGMPAFAKGVDCGVHVLDKSTNTARWLDLSPFASEIYDMIALEPTVPMRGDRTTAMQERLRALNAHTPELRHHSSQADQYCREFNGVIRELIDTRRDYATASRILKRLLARAGRPRPQWQFDYATCLLETGNAQGALEHYRRASQQGYPRASMRDAMARALAAAGVDDETAHVELQADEAQAHADYASQMQSNTILRAAATPARAQPAPVSAPADALAHEPVDATSDPRARAEATLARLREKAGRTSSRSAVATLADTTSGATPHAS